VEVKLNVECAKESRAVFLPYFHHDNETR